MCAALPRDAHLQRCIITKDDYDDNDDNDDDENYVKDDDNDDENYDDDDDIRKNY